LHHQLRRVKTSFLDPLARIPRPVCVHAYIFNASSVPPLPDTEVGGRGKSIKRGYERTSRVSFQKDASSAGGNAFRFSEGSLLLSDCFERACGGEVLFPSPPFNRTRVFWLRSTGSLKGGRCVSALLGACWFWCFLWWLFRGAPAMGGISNPASPRP
jgi:hypothetical protein